MEKVLLTLPIRKREWMSIGAPETRSWTPTVRLRTPSAPTNRAIAPGAPLAMAEFSAATTPSMSGAGTAGVVVAAGATGAPGAANALVAGATPAASAAIRVALTARRRFDVRGTVIPRLLPGSSGSFGTAHGSGTPQGRGGTRPRGLVPAPWIMSANARERFLTRGHGLWNPNVRAAARSRSPRPGCPSTARLLRRA